MAAMNPGPGIQRTRWNMSGVEGSTSTIPATSWGKCLANTSMWMAPDEWPTRT